MTEPASTPPGGPALLELDGIEAGYGPFRALFGVSFSIPPGAVVALVGPNGAGKTTVARVCSGLVKPTAGRLLLDGQDVTGQRPETLARKGIAHAPEGRSVFATLTIQENLALSFRSSLSRKEADEALERAYEMFPRLGERRRQLAGSLSGGEQRMLTMARVLVLKPRLVIADELSLGLAPIVTNEVYGYLADIRDGGTALLIVEQLLDHALGIADQVVVLDTGKASFNGPTSALGDRADGFPIAAPQATSPAPSASSDSSVAAAPSPGRPPARRAPLRAQRSNSATPPPAG